MIEIVKHSKKAKIIIACALAAILSVSAVCFDWFAWAQPAAAEEIIPMAEAPEEEGLVLCALEGESDAAPEADVPAETEVPAEPVAEPEPEVPQAPPLPKAEADGYVTVGLYSSCSSVSGGSVSEMKISCEDGFFIAKKVNRGWTPDVDYRNYTSFTVKTEGGSVNLYDANGSVVVTGLCKDDVLMSAASDRDSRIITIGGNKYRDGVMFIAESGSKMSVINFIDMEHYLWGSINLEMTYNNPLEALKAQAVASRSFAVAHYGYHGSYGFDLCTSSNCQSYKGVSAEKSQTVQACKETSGQVMVSNGKIASGYYYASSGGYTMNSEDVWGGTISYLKAVEDIYAPLTVWNSSLTFEELSSRLSSKGYSVGNIQSVEITGRYSTGGVKSMVISGDAGSVTLSGAYNPASKSIVSVIGSSTLKSIFFSMGENSYPGVAVTDANVRDKYVTTSGEVQMSMVYVLGENGEIDMADICGAYVAEPRTVRVLKLASKSVPYKKPNYTQEIVTGGAVYFSGTGFGHGAGLPQTSAIAMAKAGKTYDAILTYYYTGIELKQFRSL